MSRIRRFIFSLFLQQIFLLLILAIYWWLTHRPDGDMVFSFPRQEDSPSLGRAPKRPPDASSPVPDRSPGPDPAGPPAPKSQSTADNLQRIEGIGPKMSALLVANGITTFHQLAGLSPEELVEIVTRAGARIVNPETWPEQAALAAVGNWDALAALQSTLKGGRRSA